MSGREYQPINPTRGDTKRGSFSINVDTGAWGDFATDKAGGDLISLYAYLHNVSQGKAAEVLAGLEGIVIERKSAPKNIEVPDRKHDFIWNYHETDGNVSFQVCRWNTPAGKIVRPISRNPTDSSKLVRRWPTGVRPLFDAHLIRAAEHKHKTVLLVEGEPAMDAARAMLYDAHKDIFVTTWSGGTGQIAKNDWSILIARKVFLLPDNDVAGRRGMLKIAHILETQGAAVVSILDPHSQKVPRGWDVADFTESVDGSFIDYLKFAKANHCYTAEIYERKVNPPPEVSDKDINLLESDTAPFRCLGTYRRAAGRLDYYFLSHYSGAFLTMQADQLNEVGLQELADVVWWESNYASKGKAVDWKLARQVIIRSCHAHGNIDIASKIRGRGVWAGKNGIVVHEGSKLFDGKNWIKPTESTDYLFEQRPALGITNTTPAQLDELQGAYDAISKPYWIEDWMPKFLFGWILAAPFSGLLDWRTHLVITGGTGSGKSTIGREVIGRLLKPFLISNVGTTTEPGIRRALGMEALPAKFDENEKHGQSQRARAVVAQILQFARVSSSEGDDVIRHGDGNTYRPRSMMAFTWIDPAMNEEADQNRFVVCELKKDSGGAKRKQHFEDFMNAIHLIRNDYPTRAFWWVYNNLDQWIECAKAFRQVYQQQHGSARKADMLAPIYALSYLAMFGTIATPETATKFIAGAAGDAHAGLDVSRDEDTLLEKIMHHVLKYRDERGDFIEIMVQEAIDTDWRTCNQRTELHAALRRWGVKVKWAAGGAINPNKDTVAFANSGEGINELLAGTRWQDGWPKILARTPTAGAGSYGMQFVPGTSSRYVSMPIRLCLLPDDYR